MIQVMRQWSHCLLTRKSQRNRNGQTVRISKATTNNVDNFTSDMELKNRKVKCSKSSTFSCQKGHSHKHKQKENKMLENCSCANCAALPVFTECGICLDPLQGHEIKSCPVCANLTCKNCASRLVTCAFCRTKLPMERNRAVERLLNKLSLPCKNSRQGCRTLLDADNRFIHETFCNYSIIQCPIESSCKWRGPVAAAQCHFKAIHDLIAVSHHGIIIEIHSFLKKAMTAGGRQYTVSLACYDQLFVVKVIIHKSELKILLSRLGYVCNVPLTAPPATYGILLEILSNEKSFSSFVTFTEVNCDFQKITVNCNKLCTSNNNLAPMDTVKINASVEQNTPKNRFMLKFTKKK